jgi:hypothetical protein
MGQRHAPDAFYPRERPGTHCTGGWVGPRAGLDRCGKSRPTEIRSPDRPARSQSLYRLSYRAQNYNDACNFIFNVNFNLCILTARDNPLVFKKIEPIIN